MPQLGLFEQSAPPRSILHDYQGVPGLTYAPEFLTPAEQARVLAEVDARPWQDDLKRRVQHYGYKYDYKARSVNLSMYLGPLPSFARDIGQRLRDCGLIVELPDQLIVNNYEPGQGITAHVDCEPCFKDTIVTISLGWAYEMDFIPVNTPGVKPLPILLECGSALVMRGPARHEWMHRINARLRDRGVPRKRRVSLTFRNVVLE
jgi:alkylated DNA repair dioxygenase AlkB